MRTTSIFSLLIALVAAAACSNDTGILINASASPAIAQDIQFLRFYVGEELGVENGYYSDDRPLQDVSLDGRDIAVNPYSLLIRGGDVDTPIIVAVLAIGPQGDPIGFGRLENPVSFLSGKVLEWDVEIGRMDDVFETDYCLKWYDEDGRLVHIGRPGDQDCDGAFDPENGGDDCDDRNPNVFPGNQEDCSNFIDDDCNGYTDMEDNLDADRLVGDNDGYAACGSGPLDCNNADRSIHPGALDECNGIDDDCDGLCDGGFDVDGDFVTTCGSFIGPEGQCVFIDEQQFDCDDNEPTNFPGNEEICDGRDNNCSGVCDDEDFDKDEDGFTECGSVVGLCNTRPDFADCDDDKAEIHPGAVEICDGIDQNCDGDEDAPVSPCFASADGDCQQGTRNCIGGELIGECETTDAIVSSSICESYNDCQAQPPLADPLTCVLDGEGFDAEESVDCKVGIGGNTQCEQRTVRIVAPDNAGDCSYTVIGGSFQQGYRVDLVGFGGGEQTPVLFECDAVLFVKALPGAGQAHIFIAYSSEQTPSHLIDVRLQIDQRNDCGELLGLDCNGGWDNVPLPPSL